MYYTHFFLTKYCPGQHLYNKFTRQEKMFTFLSRTLLPHVNLITSFISMISNVEEASLKTLKPLHMMDQLCIYIKDAETTDSNCPDPCIYISFHSLHLGARVKTRTEVR